MADGAYLQRGEAPLTDEQWSAIDEAVTRTAQRMLCGRRFISLVGPLGPGVQAVSDERLADGELGRVDLLGTGGGSAITLSARRNLPLPLIYQDFWLHWRDVAANGQLGMPLDTGRAAAAAVAVARAEDRLIFEGDASLGLPGLLTVEGRVELPLGDWSSRGAAFADVVAGAGELVRRGAAGPFALAVGPSLYAELNRVLEGTGVLELERIERLASRGVLATPVLPEGHAVLVDSGPDKMDLAVGMDTTTAFVESTDLNYRFRVVESLVLRIRRPGAICVFGRRATGL
jgi:uncharacterized linocin/CFP29 family protein